MLITIQEHLAHSSVIVRVADFFLWPLTHSELRMQISSEWILKIIWSSRQERVFLPLCESDAHKGIQTAWVLEDLAMCMFQAPGRKFQEESACSLSWCSGQELLPLQLAYQSFTHSSFNSSLLSFLPCSVHFIFLFFFPFTDSFKQAANTYWLTKHKNNDNNRLCLLSSGGENANWLSEFSPCFPTVRWL